MTSQETFERWMEARKHYDEAGEAFSERRDVGRKLHETMSDNFTAAMQAFNAAAAREDEEYNRAGDRVNALGVLVIQDFHDRLKVLESAAREREAVVEGTS